MIYGIHAIQALLESDPQRFLEVFILKKPHLRHLHLLTTNLESGGIAVHPATRESLDRKVGRKAHQGIVARVREFCTPKEHDLQGLIKNVDTPFLLVLDGVTDPHNLGACLRTADAAGVHAVIVPRDRSAPLNAVAKKVACGAAEHVPLIRVTNLARTLRSLQEMSVWLVGTSGETSNTLYQTKIIGSAALIMGSESRGMRHLTREHCDKLISIPMLGSVSSVNVSVATGICLFEIVRQRLFFLAAMRKGK